MKDKRKICGWCTSPGEFIGEPRLWLFETYEQTVKCTQCHHEWIQFVPRPAASPHPVPEGQP